jgi:hypothetical protein
VRREKLKSRKRLTDKQAWDVIASSSSDEHAHASLDERLTVREKPSSLHAGSDVVTRADTEDE